MAGARKSKSSSRGGFLTHRGLVAIEAMLVMGVVKDWIFEALRTSGFPNYVKVLLVMGTTIGLFGGLFVVVERLTARGMAGTHRATRNLPVVVPTALVHGALLFLLFLQYARMLKLKVF